MKMWVRPSITAILLACAISARAFTITNNGVDPNEGNPAGQTDWTVAYDLSDAGNSFVVYWSQAHSPAPITGTAEFTLYGLHRTSNNTGWFDWSVVIRNLAGYPPPSTGGVNEYISAIGLDLDQGKYLNWFGAGAVFGNASSGSEFPAFSRVDSCIYAGTRCSASNAGLPPGQVDAVLFEVAGQFPNGNPSGSLSDFAVKFAGDEGGWELQGVPSCPGRFPGCAQFQSSGVSEPATFALLSLGLIGMLRRSKGKS